MRFLLNKALEAVLEDIKLFENLKNGKKFLNAMSLL